MINLFTGLSENSFPQSTAMDFVSALKATHQAQAPWSAMPLSEKQTLLEAVAAQLEVEQDFIARKLAQAQGLSTKFVLENEVLPGIAAFRKTKNSVQNLQSLPASEKYFSRGFISIILPQFFAFRILCEKLAEGLLAGNISFVKTSSRNQFAGEALKKGFAKVTEWPVNLVHVFHGDEELGELMISHPAIKAVIASSNPKTAEKILQIAVAERKEIQLLTGFHNSALILADVDLDKTVESLMESCFRGMGQLPWNIQNILVLESQLEEFEKKFVAKLSGLTFSDNENSDQVLGPLSLTKKGRIESLWNQIKSENGRVVFDGSLAEGAALKVKPLVVKDLSHCSTLQQDWLGAPAVLISPVKYAHEMVKWTNTSYYGNIAQIFGAPEKIEKFGSQLEVGSVLGPDWIRGVELKHWGVKQSFYGNGDSSAFGSFFSQRRSIHYS